MTEHLRNTPHNLTRNPRLETPMTLTPTAEVYHGDCIETMNAMPPESVDAIVTDPPYGLGFMGKKWDDLPPSREWAEACFRVLKPGGHIAAFGGTRTWHRLAVAIEDAGFEMRDSLAWLYGSGFPKSHDVSKGIDKLAGAEREVIGTETRMNEPSGIVNVGQGERVAIERKITAPATPEAVQWDGWGTALKPAFEPIVLARKPLAEGTVARNVLAHGTGALNIDATRIGPAEERSRTRGKGTWMFHGFSTLAELEAAAATGGECPDGRDAAATLARYRKVQDETVTTNTGRWPANVLLDPHAAAWVDEQSGVQKDGVAVKRNLDPEADKKAAIYGTYKNGSRADITYGGGGGASRFFKVAESDENGAISPYFPREFDDAFLYTAKAPKRERPNVDGVQHPTVKPLAIMRWLIRLVTTPGGTVLDPFAGSGATIEAAIIEGFSPIGIELEAEYLPLIQHRIDRQGGDES